MKKILSLALIMLSLSSAYSQTKQFELEKEIASKKTGDDKTSFSSMLNALGKFTSQDEATITLQPTLYGLGAIFNPKLKEQDNFIRNPFLRNFQLNLGLTPSDESIFHIDDFQSGFSYAILNNKKLTAADYAKLTASEPTQQRRRLNVALARFAFDNRRTAAGLAARGFLNKVFTDEELSTMDPVLKSFLKEKLGVGNDSDLKAMSTGFTAAYKTLTTELSKRTLYTVDFKSSYSFADNDWSELSFTPLNLYCYFNKKRLGSPGLNAKFNYVIGTDTSTKEALKRKTIETELGMNFPIKVNPDTEKAALEIKPGLTYKYIAQRLYKDEKRSKLDPTLTFRLRINDDFYLPLKLEYDTENAELFGFLSIQFSLN